MLQIGSYIIFSNYKSICRRVEKLYQKVLGEYLVFTLLVGEPRLNWIVKYSTYPYLTILIYFVKCKVGINVGFIVVIIIIIIIIIIIYSLFHQVECALFIFYYHLLSSHIIYYTSTLFTTHIYITSLFILMHNCICMYPFIMHRHIYHDTFMIKNDQSWYIIHDDTWSW